MDGTLYAPDFSQHDRSATSGLGAYVAFEPVSQTPVQGSGTAADPWRVTTVVEAPGAMRIEEQTSYVSGSPSYRVETSVENLRTDAAVSAILYHAGDCYASGSDIGFGFTRTEIGSAGCSETEQNVPAGRTIQMAPLSSGSSYYEAFFRQVWEQIATQTPFPDTCRCDEHVDNGVGLSWTLLVGAGSRQTRSLTVSFTETQQAAPGADSDGDALPDAWEAGSAPSGDYENLAPLGADPNRKDVFVHADHMVGCEPPPGWEQDAIRVFADHGVTLHVDTGPTSVNSGGRTWGTLSRAGAIPYQQVLPIWGDTFDRLKDEHFVASDRRRAFHYAVFTDATHDVVRNKTIVGGGQSRGIEAADFVVGTCQVPPTLQGRIDRKRWTTVTFVHELGHNLGLRHGGFDDVIGKPNYHSVMNYFWGWIGGTTLPRRLLRPGEASVAMPNFSESLRPSLDERSVDERTQVVLPVAWVCPGKPGNPEDVRYEFGSSGVLTGTIDWDCDGIEGERTYPANLNGSGWGFGDLTLLGGSNDWAPFAMRFDGAGVLGDFDVPPQGNPPVEPRADGRAGRAGGRRGRALGAGAAPAARRRREQGAHQGAQGNAAAGAGARRRARRAQRQRARARRARAGQSRRADRPRRSRAPASARPEAAGRRADPRAAARLRARRRRGARQAPAT